MISLASIPERSFTDLSLLRAFLAAQDRREHEVALSDVSLDEVGVLRAGVVEGRLTVEALNGILRLLEIPEAFALYVCSPELLGHVIERLAKDKKGALRVQMTDGVVTGCLPPDYLPIRHDVLANWLAYQPPINEATWSTRCLRIIMLRTGPVDLLPNDGYACGWELVNYENGSLGPSTQVWRYVVRLVCSNGITRFDQAPAFARAAASQEPILESLDRLGRVLEQNAVPPALAAAVKWASGRPLGEDLRPVMDYLARMLEGDATRLGLVIGAKASWYDLLNAVTALGRTRPLEMRRRHEAAGGLLLGWFARQGRAQPP